ncbi:unnamed protein product [Tenebrio molitor]|nr:unnamed protein product [Tenebrio molitor]
MFYLIQILYRKLIFLYIQAAKSFFNQQKKKSPKALADETGQSRGLRCTQHFLCN